MPSWGQTSTFDAGVEASRAAARKKQKAIDDAEAAAIVAGKEGAWEAYLLRKEAQQDDAESRLALRAQAAADFLTRIGAGGPGGGYFGAPKSYFPTKMQIKT